MANIKVAVRVRPISERELNRTGAEIVVHTDSNKVSLTNLKVSSSKAGDSRERTRRYGFDYCFDSSNPHSELCSTQERIYETLGKSVLDAVFSGYNSCLIAYGQSASGKTYTMMGPKADPGLTPRLCEGIFLRVSEDQENDRTYQTSVSYLEIYNERVRDLLKPSSSPGSLRVREHPRLGPYVQGLTHHIVSSLGSLMSYVEEGTKARKTASTLQNLASSRSHALLTVSVSPKSPENHISPETRILYRGSKLHLVDLAGSESAATCGGVHRLKEGANINKSLVALGNVISALAGRGSTGSGPGKRFIPYRDSALTWLLKDALGGNATTIMLATISPASGSYNETAHTLRFAQRAQSVVNRPVVNEDPVARLIRDLRTEVARLKSLLLEKNIDTDINSICCCKQDQSKGREEDKSTAETSQNTLPLSSLTNGTWNLNPSPNYQTVIDTPRRKYSSNESLASKDIRTGPSIRKFGSLEYLGATASSRRDYSPASLNQDVTNASVFVDIPTLVAVLIKPDSSHSAHIEEICAESVLENHTDDEILEDSVPEEIPRTVSLISDSFAKLEVGESGGNPIGVLESDPSNTETTEDLSFEAHFVASESSASRKETGAGLRKQDSIDVDSERKSNLTAFKELKKDENAIELFETGPLNAAFEETTEDLSFEAQFVASEVPGSREEGGAGLKEEDSIDICSKGKSESVSKKLEIDENATEVFETDPLNAAFEETREDPSIEEHSVALESPASREEIGAELKKQDSVYVCYKRKSNLTASKKLEEDENPIKLFDTDPLDAAFEETSEVNSDVSECFPSRTKTRARLSKQDSIDIVSPKKSNLNASKKFGSAEGLIKKKESNGQVQKSQASSEKRHNSFEKSKKLNKIKEIEDRKFPKVGNFWRSLGYPGKDLLRKGSNDSDKSVKDSVVQKAKAPLRRQSTESPKRKTSKDSSSSSLKEDQTSTSTSIKDKSSRRSSWDQEGISRGHTPIQRTNRRAEIVAAVTQRLYATKKNPEETTANTPGSDIRSPESSDVKLATTTRMKLQEISRKMLAKRRKICVDTQTDNSQTVRVKDTASLTDNPEVVLRDIGVLTECHEDCERGSQNRQPVRIVKEMATLTERLKRFPRCRDVGLLTDIYDDDFTVKSPRNDSGIMSDDTQNYAESSMSSTEVSELCVDLDNQTQPSAKSMETSTNTIPVNSRQTMTGKQDMATGAMNFDVECEHCHKHCACTQPVPARSAERNVISISLPDMINITIESSNTLESKISVMESTDHSNEIVRNDFKDNGTQTDKASKQDNHANDLSISTKTYSNQTDGRTFRIENIFQDPRNDSRLNRRIEILPDLTENVPAKNSLIFTNSVGTSFVPETKESSTEIDRENFRRHYSHGVFRRGSLTSNKMTEDASALRQRRQCASPKRRAGFISSSFPLPETLPILNPVREIRLRTCGAKFEIQPLPRQEPDNESDASIKSTVEQNKKAEELDGTSRRYFAKGRRIERNSREESQEVEKTEDKTYERVRGDVAGLKSPMLVAMLTPKSSFEADPVFSDDSLDLNEESTGTTTEGSELMLDTKEENEKLCPPDVVAQTKKDSPKCFPLADKIEPAIRQEFEDNQIEMPKTNPNSICPVKDMKLLEYKSLILGVNYFVPINEKAHAVNDTESGRKFVQADNFTPESRMNGSNRKKKVSFSSSELQNKEFRCFGRRNDSPTPKSIIKKKNHRSSSHDLSSDNAAIDSIASSSAESSLSSILKPKMNSSTPLDCGNSEASFRDDISTISDNSGSTLKSGTFDNSDDEYDRPEPNTLDAECKKVRFSTPESMGNATSESESQENTASEDESPGMGPREIFTEYLDEAATFMRNMNSMNKFMSASKLFGKFVKSKDYHDDDFGEEDVDDFVEYEGQKISLDDNTEEFLKEDQFVVPMEPYKNCLKGIERLEKCIREADRHSKLLEEKYGVNIESADTKFGLVNSSTDSKRFVPSENRPPFMKPEAFSNLRRPKDVSSSAEELTRIEQRKWRNILENDEEIAKNSVILNYEDNFDDLEARICKHLINAVDPNNLKSGTKPRFRRATRMSDLRAQNSTSYSNLRDKYCNVKGGDSISEETISEYIPYSSEGLCGVGSYFRGSKETASRKGSSGAYVRELSPRPAENACDTSGMEYLRPPECSLFLPTMAEEGTKRDSLLSPSWQRNEYSNGSTSSSDAIGTSTESINTISSVRHKLKYPGSPRARLLQLLSERRRIVQNSRIVSGR